MMDSCKRSYLYSSPVLPKSLKPIPSQLPNEILFNVFQCLQMKDLTERCSLASKSWFQLIHACNNLLPTVKVIRQATISKHGKFYGTSQNNTQDLIEDYKDLVNTVVNQFNISWPNQEAAIALDSIYRKIETSFLVQNLLIRGRQGDDSGIVCLLERVQQGKIEATDVVVEVETQSSQFNIASLHLPSSTRYLTLKIASVGSHSILLSHHDAIFDILTDKDAMNNRELLQLLQYDIPIRFLPNFVQVSFLFLSTNHEFLIFRRHPNPAAMFHKVKLILTTDWSEMIREQSLALGGEMVDNRTIRLRRHDSWLLEVELKEEQLLFHVKLPIELKKGCCERCMKFYEEKLGVRV